MPVSIGQDRRSLAVEIVVPEWDAIEVSAGDKGAALRRSILRSLEFVWESDGSKVWNLSRGGYIQAAKWSSGGLQIECVSDAFLADDERLSFVQRRQLANLGFDPPSGISPNHYARYTERSDLAEVATLLSRVVLEVFDDVVIDLADEAPVEPTLVVPVGKCSPELLREATRALIKLMTDAGRVALIDVSTPGLSLETLELSDIDAVSVPPTQVLATYAPHMVVVTGFRQTTDIGDQLRDAADVVDCTRSLIEDGRSVIVVGPALTDETLWLYRRVGLELADRLVILGSEHEIQGGAFERVTTRIVRSAQNRHAGLRTIALFERDEALGLTAQLSEEPTVAVDVVAVVSSKELPDPLTRDALASVFAGWEDGSLEGTPAQGPGPRVGLDEYVADLLPVHWATGLNGDVSSADEADVRYALHEISSAYGAVEAEAAGGPELLDVLLGLFCRVADVVRENPEVFVGLHGRSVMHHDLVAAIVGRLRAWKGAPTPGMSPAVRAAIDLLPNSLPVLQDAAGGVVLTLVQLLRIGGDAFVRDARAYAARQSPLAQRATEWTILEAAADS